MTDDWAAFDPRSKWRTLPRSPEPENLVAEQAVEPTPSDLIFSDLRSPLRLATDAGG